MIKNNPITGIGNHFNELLPQYLNKTGLEYAYRYNHPHNQFLYFFSIGGVILGMTFVIINSILIYFSVLFEKRLLLYLITAALVFMIFDLLLNSLYGVMPFTFFLSLVILLEGQKELRSIEDQPSSI